MMNTQIRIVFTTASFLLFFLCSNIHAQGEWKTFENHSYYEGGFVGIGIHNPATELHVAGILTANAFECNLYGTDLWIAGTYDEKRISYLSLSWQEDSWHDEKTMWLSGKGGMKFFTNEQVNMVLDFSGNLGLGTTSPEYKLDVVGSVRAHEILVNTQKGADFVFEKDYSLPSLKEVEQFITENKHLPEIAPADSMVRNGVNMGDMQIKLLQKIEELTLYMIDQEKRIGIQEKKIEQQEEKIKELEKQSFIESKP